MHKTFRFFRWSGKRAILSLVLIIVLAVVAVDVTVAAILTRTYTIRNKFAAPELEVSTWSGNDVINSGDTPIYVRAIVIATWTSDNAEKTVHAFSPTENIDYEIEVDSTNWFKASDGFYYHRNALNPAQSVQLINSATQLKQNEGHTLKIFVISSAMQTMPTDAVETSWTAVEVAEDGTLRKKTS